MPAVVPFWLFTTFPFTFSYYGWVFYYFVQDAVHVRHGFVAAAVRLYVCFFLCLFYLAVKQDFLVIPPVFWRQVRSVPPS